jgi:hypothetical protein
MDEKALLDLEEAHADVYYKFKQDLETWLSDDKPCQIREDSVFESQPPDFINLIKISIIFDSKEFQQKLFQLFTNIFTKLKRQTSELDFCLED